jgi:hypothetical protein
MTVAASFVPNLPVTDVARANGLYAQIFELGVGMDLGWVGNLAPADAPAVQLQVMTSDASAGRGDGGSGGQDLGVDFGEAAAAGVTGRGYAGSARNFSRRVA